jgi:NADPH-dependent 2,4-dienoyl-CoA reductase/sulfur reductase-like enzyme
MAQKSFKYIVVGGGLAGNAAVEGIRSTDKDASVLLVGKERHLPYDRPPLTKKLWFGKKKVEEIFSHNSKWFDDNHIQVMLETTVGNINRDNKTIILNNGIDCDYEKLLLATGGTPRKLQIEGGDMEEIFYYRYLDDYLRLKDKVFTGLKILVIGGGFIGSEIAAAMNINKADVTMIITGNYLCENIFPKELADSIQQDYIRRGIKIINNDSAESIVQEGKYFHTRTKNGQEIMSGAIITGIGISPETELAESAGLKINNGIVVNEYLQSSDQDIYAAGDNANFPYQTLGKQMRVEHWDNAINQGRTAGMNMAGASVPYTYMPYFFSDLFDFGYEAVGNVNSKLETFADWEKENNTGIIYYLENGVVCGAMMCNVCDKVDAARELIKSKREITEPQLHQAIR